MTQDVERAQQRLIEQEGRQNIHRANLRAGGPDPADRARLLDKTVESELEFSDNALDNLKAKDFPLANFDELEDTTEFKWVQEILELMQRARYPHPRSGLQGVARAWATNDRSNQLEALDLRDIVQDESGLMGTYSRATRGEGGMQQETAAKTVNESVAISENDNAGGGLLGRFKS